jgi:hypothetical protein
MRSALFWDVTLCSIPEEHRSHVDPCVLVLAGCGIGLNKNIDLVPCLPDFAIKDIVGFVIQVKCNKNN